MEIEKILARLKSLKNPEAVKGMARFGINPKKCYGITIPVLRKLARENGKDHALAGELWKSGIREARILAAMVDEPAKVTEKQVDSWVEDIDSWDVCDSLCMNLLEKTGFAYRKAAKWSCAEKEFVKRAGFALMARLAVSDKRAGDENFRKFFPLIKKEACDERNYVKKAVNWALRQIGKRNRKLNKEAVKTAREIKKMDSKSARWIAADGLRELAVLSDLAFAKKRKRRG